MTSIDETVEKIRKILRLVRGATTEGERNAALLAAKRLANANNLSIESLMTSVDADKVVEVRDEEVRAMHNTLEAHMAGQILRAHFAVCVIWTTYRYRKGASVTWVGSSLNIGVAKYAYIVLVRAVRRDWNLMRKVYPYMKRGSFFKGWFAAVHNTLTANPLRNDDGFKADTKALEYKMSNMDGIGTVKTRNGRTDKDALVAGYESGSKVRLSRPTEDKGYTPTQGIGVTHALEMR